MTQLMEIEAAQTVLGTPAKELAFRVHSKHPAGAAQVVLLAGQKVSIGADPDCTLRLAGPRLEPCYCFVLRGEANDVVRALSPRVKLNGNEFQDAPLHGGDRLQLGDVELEVLASPDAPERDWEAERRVVDALAEEVRQRSETVEARFTEIEQREHALRESEVRHTETGATQQRQQAELDAQREALTRERESAERQAAELQQRHEALEARRAEAERREQSLRETESALAGERESLAQERRQLDEQAAGLNAQRQSIEQAASEAASNQGDEIRQRSEELAAREEKLTAERRAWELDVQSLRAERDQVQASRTQLDAEQAKLVAERMEVQELANRFAAERKGAEETQTELAEVRRQLQAARDELAARPQEHNTAVTIGAAEVKAEREREELRQEREAWELERRQWEQECERWERESREFQADLEERERRLQQSLDQVDDRRESVPMVEAASLPDDEPAASADVEPELDRRSDQRPVPEAGDDEDSIQDYMQQLLQRANVKPKAATAAASHVPYSAELRPQAPDPGPAKPAAPVERPVRRPDRPKAEQAVDLSTLREIANLTAKGAIERHSERKSAQKRLNRILLVGGGFAFTMIVLACLGIYPTITAALAVAATAVAFLGWRQYQLSLRRYEGALNDKPAETPPADATPSA